MKQAVASNQNNGDLIKQASALQADGKLPEALLLLEKILKNDPIEIEALKRKALVQMQTGAFQAGYETVKAAQKIRPQSKSLLQIQAVAAMAVHAWAEAIQCFEVLTRENPDFALYFQEWSKAEYQLNNYKRAIDRYQDFLKRIPKATPAQHFTLGKLFFQNRQPSKAARVLDQVLNAGFVNSEMLAIRANCYLHAGATNEAKNFFQRAIDMDADNVEAHLQYRQMIKTEAGDPIFDQLKALEQKPTLGVEQKMIVNFLLGNLHHGLKQFAKAFPYFQTGNVLNKEINAASGYAYDAAGVGEEFKILKQAFTAETLKALDYKGSDSEMPVFIVGMPRSGTTLLEQIISAHHQAEGRGELDTMHYIHSEFVAELEKSKSPDVGKILAEKGKGWQDRYLAALSPSRSNTKRVTDKLPANFRSLGFIAALFPKAKIIHIQRNPLDTSVSIFCNMFDNGHPYATNLENIGDYFRQHLNLMDVWKRNLPMDVLEINYEDLVVDQEQKSREIIAFLGLEWDAACLEFHKVEKAAMTLSSMQVRKPMTTSSVARWKRYDKFLGDLETGLGPDLTNKAKG